MSDLQHEATLVKALKGRKGRATLGDIVVDTGLPKAQAEAGIKQLLKIYDSHLEVDDNGEILYLFDPSMRRRSDKGAFKRAVRQAARAAWKAFKFLFKIAIMVTLVVYFLLFVVLLIAAFVAMASRGGSSDDSRRGPITPIFWIGRVFFVPDVGRGGFGGRSRGRRARSGEKEEPYYKRIFAYVFGPEANDETEEDPFSDEKLILQYIRAQKGVVTASELATRTGWGVTEAESRIASLMADYDGDVRVTRHGTLLYTFHGLARSAADGRTAVPAPVWERFEPKKLLTGNGGGTNALITFLNGFNLVGAWIAPYFIMPQLGLEGPLIYFALSVFPFLFSLVFFAVPLFRWFFVMAENARRAARNHWRFVLREIYARARRQSSVVPTEVVDAALRNYPKRAAGKPDSSKAKQALERAVKDHNPEIESAPSGTLIYRFDELARELDEGQRARELVDDSQLRLGKIVFSTADDDLGLDQLDDFDRQVSGEPQQLPDNQLQQLAPELAEFDDELAGTAPVDDQQQAKLDEFERRLAEAAVPAESTAKK